MTSQWVAQVLTILEVICSSLVFAFTLCEVTIAACCCPPCGVTVTCAPLCPTEKVVRFVQPGTSVPIKQWVLFQNRLSHQASQAACSALGGSLVAVTSASEHDRLYQEFAGAGEGVWIGLVANTTRNPNIKSEWRWIGTSQSPGNGGVYDGWGSMQPASLNASTPNRCAAAWLASGGYWAAQPCSSGSTLPYACETPVTCPGQPPARPNAAWSCAYTAVGRACNATCAPGTRGNVTARCLNGSTGAAWEAPQGSCRPVRRTDNTTKLGQGKT